MGNMSGSSRLDELGGDNNTDAKNNTSMLSRLGENNNINTSGITGRLAGQLSNLDFTNFDKNKPKLKKKCVTQLFALGLYKFCREQA